MDRGNEKKKLDKKNECNIFDDSINVTPLDFPKFKTEKKIKSFNNAQISEKIVNLKFHHPIPNKKVSLDLDRIFFDEENKLSSFSKNEKNNYFFAKQICENFLMNVKNFEICSEILKNSDKINNDDCMKGMEEMMLSKLKQKKFMKTLRYYDKEYENIEGEFKQKVSEEMLKKLEIHKSQILYLYDNLEGGINNEIERTLKFMPDVLKKLESSNRELIEIQKSYGCDIENDMKKLKSLISEKEKKMEKLSEILVQYHYNYLKYF